MADAPITDIREYPAGFRKFGVVPSADHNTAGYKDPDMNNRPAVQAKPRPARKEKMAKPRTAPPTAARKKPAASDLDAIKRQAAISGGTTFGNKPPWAGNAAVEPEVVLPEDTGDYDPFTVDPDLVPDAVVEARPRPQAHAAPRAVSAGEGYLGQKARLTMELADGQCAMPITDLRQSMYSVLVLVPLRDDSSVFIPKLGSKLTLAYKDQSIKVMYPGSYVEVEELKTGFLTFIKDES